MLFNINEIKINETRRALSPSGIEELAKSIADIGLLNPISVSEDHTLIAGYHRLEAAKKLGWTEIECNVCKLEGLHAELAEIDENIVRTELTTTEKGELLLRRKAIYEELHPETRHGMRNGQTVKDGADRFSSAKSFVQDTAEKMGISPSTVSRQVQAAKNTTAEAKEIIMENDLDLSQQEALKLSRLEPEQQAEAAAQLAAQEIKSVDEYKAADAGTPESADQTGEAKPDNSSDGEQGEADAQEAGSGNSELFQEITEFAETILDGIRLYNAAPDRFTQLSPEQAEALATKITEVSAAFQELAAGVRAAIQ